jgi:hypothetical protein
MAGSVREALEQAFADHEAGAAETGSTLEPIVDDTIIPEQPRSTKPNPYSAEGQAEGGEGGGEEEEVVVREEPVKTPSKLKLGQKAGPRPAAAQSQADPNADDADGNVVPLKAGAVKAPQSWKPAMREQFMKLKPDMQQEILRRESETGRALSESANSRKFHQDFSQVVRPFEALIAGSGVHPLKAVQNLMTTAATLQTGTAVQKAGTIANIIRTYGVDINTLDQILSGQKPKPGTAGAPALDEAAIDRIVQQRLSQHPIITGNQRAQQEQQQRMLAEADQNIETFGQAAENKYFEDLREDMGDLLEMAANRGRVMSMKEAYDTAAAAHPEISKLVAKERAVAAAQKGRTSVERARRAASSQPQGQPGNVRGGGAAPKGIRSAVAQAWDDLSAGT